MRRLDLVEVEKKSIRNYVKSQQDKLKGNVLDFGCGFQPYRDIVLGTYFPYDPLYHDVIPHESFDAILTTQVAQFFDDPYAEFKKLFNLLNPNGHLIMTYPTNWYEVDPKDNWRFTHWGMERMLEKIGFEIVHHKSRGEFQYEDFTMKIGYGITAKKPNISSTGDEGE